MRPPRFVALGDSLTEGVGDPVGDGWRGWAALLAGGLAEGAGEPAGSAGSGRFARPGVSVGAGECVGPVEFTNLAVSGAQTRDVLERQLPAALALRPDLASVVVGVNDTLRCTFDIQAVAARLDTAYAALTERGAVLLTACLPDPGAMLGLPGALARPLARRQQAVNTVVHALSERHRAVHLHACEGAWLTDRAMWSADRLHPGERGHRQLAARFHGLLVERGLATGSAPATEPEFPEPTRSASLWWLATAGTGWAARRCTDLLPQLLTLAVDEMRHRARGTSARLDLRASAAVSAALAGLRVPEQQPDAAQAFPARLTDRERRTATKRTGVPGTACAAAGRSAGRTTAITG